MLPNAPNGVAQEECIRKAYLRAGLNPRDADYVELHATGRRSSMLIMTNMS
jgi:acyl transferase domain-containing protein